CEADTTLSAENDEVICSVDNTKVIWKPQPFPQCYKHCYLFTVEYGDVYLINSKNNGNKQIIKNHYRRIWYRRKHTNTPDKCYL
ncbi:unnamed protein product, partial [Schistosoma rodhaini]